MPRREVDPEELRQLTELFCQSGVEAPERWAPSQLAEDVPQLAISCFAEAFGEGVISEGDAQWIDKEIHWANSPLRAPGARTGLALKDMPARGASRQAITDLVRVFQ